MEESRNYSKAALLLIATGNLEIHECRTSFLCDTAHLCSTCFGLGSLNLSLQAETITQMTEWILLHDGRIAWATFPVHLPYERQAMRHFARGLQTVCGEFDWIMLKFSPRLCLVWAFMPSTSPWLNRVGRFFASPENPLQSIVS